MPNSGPDPGRDPWPSELRLSPDKTRLTVSFEGGARYVLPAEYLRVESPSAEVQGHAASQKQIVAGKHAVKIAGLEPVGNYAVRILFDDGHDTGLYSWSWLRDLGRDHDRKWATYLKELRSRKLER
ncbi:MAG: gamma-butyrobetaine hydroxylase-like domain-containing protein [Rhizomicrobium sp.]